MPDQPRPVWINREQYNMLRSLMQTWPDVAKPLVAAWDAAPVDPEAAIREAMLPIQAHTYDYTEEAAAALRALGKPDDHEPPLGARCN